MTSQDPTLNPATPARPVGHGGTMEALAGYAAAMEQGETPIIGYLVLYSVFDSEITRDDLHRWFLALGLDDAFLPPPIREHDAFERVTGQAGVRASYRIDEGTARHRVPGQKAPDQKVTEATLMIRHVSRDNLKVVRHMVREVRDESRTRLEYAPRMAEITFWRDPLGSGQPGRGVLQVTPDEAEIAKLSPAEQERVRETLGKVEKTYERYCRYYSSDRLRTLVRTYVEGLNAVMVRSGGGVYFVHSTYADRLVALRGLVKHFGEGSQLARVPLPDQEEMREMVVAALTTEAREDLEKLALDITKARADGASDAQVQTLYKRFRALQDSAAEHAKLLSTSLDDTQAALQLVHQQVASLLANAG
ncbi:DUF6744 family protein [Nonomuraea angiospora]|uniref:DUF6744 family protein n=1 Tax=Nonomuraea angiospora TaxID=46172 RepID=UPI0029A82879|nr:DUF6744 family protein [Nonomuraea angiospora]MDX3100484.1 hypothetical protein [Nonomuraea angiospora]